MSTPAERRPGRSQAVTSALVLAVVVGLCAVVGTATELMDLSAGIPGRLFVEHCERVDSARPTDPFDCRGQFVGDDGLVKDDVWWLRRRRTGTPDG